MNISDHKVFVFDLGMVLVSLYRKECVENFRLLGIEDAAAMIGNCSQDGPFGALEYGLISVEKFCDELAQISSKKITEKDILNAWNSMIGETPVDLLNMIYRLRHEFGKTVCMLSNVNQPHIDNVMQNHFRQVEGRDIHDYFDALYLSHELHLKKPEPKIFETVGQSIHKKFGFCGSDIIFFDDSRDNVDMAIRYGWDSVVIANTDETMEMLRKMMDSKC
ncbi:MAG: HAD-IA family hydrolase [Paludibacteraceae bacterium]|jgi:putative hydrolase of the HAD superfamily|nr:HAD-IA family hydrolase [Paludibacteraceae bacterium]